MEKDQEMTKYAVDEGVDPDVMEKASSDGCPRCGGAVSVLGKILECQQCGTEPFEK